MSSIRIVSQDKQSVVFNPKVVIIAYGRNPFYRNECSILAYDLASNRQEICLAIYEDKLQAEEAFSSFLVALMKGFAYFEFPSIYQVKKYIKARELT